MHRHRLTRVPHGLRWLVAMWMVLHAASSPASGQVFVHPVPVTGVVQFSNANPAILGLLNPPGSEGITNLDLLANSVAPAAPIYGVSDYFSTPPGASIPYTITLDAESPGIAYNIAPRAYLLGDAEVYYFSNKVTAPVVLGQPPVTLDFTECLGVVTVKFVDNLGNPAIVDGGTILAGAGGEMTASVSVPGGQAEQRLYLNGGLTHSLSIRVHQGTDFYSNRIEAALTTNVDVTCDAFTEVTMVIPGETSLATITGVFDVQGEFAFTVARNESLDSPGYSTVVADYGSFFNQRWAAFPGTNFTASSSGAFVLTNVAPTGDDPTVAGYEVYAQAAFRTNRAINAFRTPILGYGQNPPLQVAPGAAIDLGKTFDIHPGYLRGAIRLQGPDETASAPSEFRGLYHSGDDVTDGIPTYLGTYGVYWSAIEAEGVDEKAPGAHFTASGGYGTSDFDGAVDAATSAFVGNYELALGGLNGEAAIWQRDYLSLLYANTEGTNGSVYYSANMYIHDNKAPHQEVDPGLAATNDINYCFGEVTVIFKNPDGGVFYAPTLKTSTVPGSFAGTNFLNQPADYSVYLDSAGGTPATQDQATNVGQVTVYLPEGTYTLNPSVTTASYRQTTGLPPITITVGCRQRISLESCLQLNLNSPSCVNTTAVPVSGSVRSCGNQVVSITYTLNGGASQVVCSNCGADPSFSFTLDLAGAADCSDNVLTVTATDALGGVSAVTTHIRFDSVPPVIQCPADIAAAATGANGAVVTFDVTASDNCAGAVNVQCVPPSGSLFPVGATSVSCTATDACGNTSRCTFNVVVKGADTNCALSIAPAVQVTWPCAGTLQTAPAPSGPWSDLPGAASPYYAPVGPSPTYFRVRN